MPIISVIVPVYNVEKYLKRCVDSILNQTFTDFELILVDDGSTDNSGKICDDYAQTDERVKVIHKKNGGLSDARNSGLDIAVGEYISFIDSDDWVDKDFLKPLYENAVTNDADISIVNFHSESDEKAEKPGRGGEGLYDRNEIMDFFFSDISTYMIVAWNKLYKHHLFDEIRYPLGKVHEDVYTTHKLIYKSNRVFMSEADLYHYYHRDDSITQQAFSIKRIDEYFAYKDRSEFFKNCNRNDLFIKNEKAKFGCIKALTVKIISSDINHEEKRKYLSVFKKDVRKNFKYMIKDRNLIYIFGDFIYFLSPAFFSYLYSRGTKQIKNIKSRMR